MNKTSADIKSEINNLRKEYQEKLHEEQFDEHTKLVYILYQSFVKAGFTEEQAFELTCRIIPCGNKI